MDDNIIKDPDNFLKDVRELADKREQFCKDAKPCPKCETVQIQIIGWADKAKWRCRRCKHKWESE